MKVLRGLALSIVMSLTLVACTSSPPTVTEVEAKKTAQSTNDAALSVGFPSTPFKLTKKTLRLIYEQQDRGFDTYVTYRLPLTGDVRLICKGYSFPVPYSTQYTRPEEMEWRGNIIGWVQMPQAEPDAVYKATSHSGTYYLCNGIKGLILEYEERNIGTTTQKKAWSGTDVYAKSDQEPFLTYKELADLAKATKSDQFETIVKRIDARLTKAVGSLPK